MELAGAQINANDGSSGEGRGTGAGLCFQTKGSPRMENAQRPCLKTSSPGGPLGAQGPICPAVPSPLSPRVSPAFYQGGGGQDGTDF